MPLINPNWDIIVCGAGTAGLAVSHLLAQKGFKVLCLEAHSVPGGCASFFYRNGFNFDVGATTLTGLQKGRPLHRFFEEVSCQLANFRDVRPGIVIKTKQGDFTFSKESFEKWGCGHQYDRFDKFIKWFSNQAWQVSLNTPFFPWGGVKDFLKIFDRLFFKRILLLPFFLISTETLLKFFFKRNYQKLAEIFNEILLISAQAQAEDTPAGIGILALNYPHEVQYLGGGMKQFQITLLKNARKAGAVFFFNKKVTSVISQEGYYRVEDHQGDFYSANKIVWANPIENLLSISQFDLKELRHKVNKEPRRWGAICAYFAVKMKHPIDNIYYQIHVSKKYPFITSSSLFFSFSPIDDLQRAPAGWQTVTVSTHTHLDWQRDESYQQKKEDFEQLCLSVFKDNFADYQLLDFTKPEIGTPLSFLRYTNRAKGMVGGIPMTFRRSILFSPSHITSKKNLYLVGDHLYPGQSISAVILGALHCCQRIKKK